MSSPAAEVCSKIAHRSQELSLSKRVSAYVGRSSTESGSGAGMGELLPLVDPQNGVFTPTIRPLASSGWSRRETLGNCSRAVPMVREGRQQTREQNSRPHRGQDINIRKTRKNTSTHTQIHRRETGSRLVRLRWVRRNSKPDRIRSKSGNATSSTPAQTKIIRDFTTNINIWACQIGWTTQEDRSKFTHSSPKLHS